MISRECRDILNYLKAWAAQINAFNMEFDLEASRKAFKLSARDINDADIKIFKANGVTAEWVSDPKADPKHCMLYLHGGGYISGDLDITIPFAQVISKATGCSILAIDYRLSPENPFPAALEDAVNAFKWMVEHGPDGKGPPEKIFIGGDSAGGGLALATLLKLRDDNETLPDCAVIMSPFADLTLSGESMTNKTAADPVLYMDFLKFCSNAYAAQTDKKHPYISPVFSDPKGLPPLMIQVGENEILLDDSIRFAENAKKAGVDVKLDVWPEMFHSWQMYAPGVPESQEALNRIGAFVKTFF